MVSRLNFGNSITLSKFTSLNDVTLSTLDVLGISLDDCQGINYIISLWRAWLRGVANSRKVTNVCIASCSLDFMVKYSS